MASTHTEHPFAEYIRILGKGKKGSRPLSQEEAYQAMSMILAEQVEPEQLGAFLMLMRIKEETPEELAGFIQACQNAMPDSNTNSVAVDLDWSSYAGKRRHLPWFILSALLLAENGYKLFMHGSSGHTENRLYTEDILRLLNIPIATSLEHAAEQIVQSNFSYLPLAKFSPKLYQIIELRPLMGLRSPVHTLARMLNPFHARYSIQGIFHPGYRPVHQQAALIIGQPNMAVLKGEGGETERNPDLPCLVQSIVSGELVDEQWPPMFAKRHIKPESLDPAQLLDLWRGTRQDEYAVAAVTGTAAIALKLLGKAHNQDDAHCLALKFWENRNKNTIPGSHL